jgi:hypothetical protein
MGGRSGTPRHAGANDLPPLTPTISIDGTESYLAFLLPFFLPFFFLSLSFLSFFLPFFAIRLSFLQAMGLWPILGQLR